MVDAAHLDHAMINIKVTTCAPDWPWTRQLPGGTSEWGPFKFHIDTEIDECDVWFVFESLSKTEKVSCPPERTVFITGEPDSLGAYSSEFLKQFHYVISGRKDIHHPRIIRMQQGHPWFVEKSFDELINMPPPVKSKELCLLTSSKAFSEGHRARLKFVDAVKAKFGDRVDIYGRGIQDFDSKWDVLSAYKYSIVLENYVGNDFVTEKLPDAWLAYCMPFYSGCLNLSSYFKSGAWVDIDMSQQGRSLNVIGSIIDDVTYYDTKLPSIMAVRHDYLLQEQFFARLIQFSKYLVSVPASIKQQLIIMPTAVTLRPKFYFLRSILGLK